MEELTQFLPIDEKAAMIELQIREFIKEHDPYLFANTSTCAKVAEDTIFVVVCYEEEIIFQGDYPDIANITVLTEFAQSFTAWRTQRAA